MCKADMQDDAYFTGEMLLIGLSCQNLSLLTCTGFRKAKFTHTRISQDNLDSLWYEGSPAWTQCCLLA